MPSVLRVVLLLLLGCCLPIAASTQPLTDTTITWRSYSHTGTADVGVYPGPPDEEETHTIVLRELAENRGPSTVEDVQYVADLVGRRFGIDPTTAYWVIHWGGFSFKGADPDAEKALFLRATFNRTESGTLSSPYWSVITETDVRELTDRRWAQ
ncbi:hypothetical protein BSZ35_12435 [Salinibacter sp. 10B]|uniref:hypothetical protein n=1 Tax=Salinibacter sp. 10B TaxID=1923971 RepID=UPI000CF50DC7|nr:hypothetical protein [Salinibacter sp. 10B]PQJ35301.1 hypothetical protein BSZ35_12435 [Salinibacter sp. 10B]